MQETISYSYARDHLKEAMDMACGHQPILVKRRSGGNVVIISEQDYRSLDETSYLLSSSKNRKHLMDSLQEVKTGKVKKFKSVKDFKTYLKSL